MRQVKLKAKTDIHGNYYSDIEFEFGATQAKMSMSSTGSHARKLKLKHGDKVEITIKKLGA